MKPVSTKWKRFASGLGLIMLLFAMPVQAQTASVQFGMVPDVLMGETFEVPVLARRLQQARAVRVQIVSDSDRLQWTAVEAGEGADGMEVIDWSVRGDTLDVVLSHLDSEVQTTLLRSEPILRLQAERTAQGILPLSFADVPLAVVTRDLAEQEVEYGEATATSTSAADETPTSFEVLGNFPDPFRSATRIEIAVPSVVDATLVVYDLLGREVFRVTHEAVGPGAVAMPYQPEATSAGLYLYKIGLESGGTTHVLHGTMTVLK